MMKAGNVKYVRSASQYWLRPARLSQQWFSTSNVTAGKRSIRPFESLCADMFGPD